MVRSLLLLALLLSSCGFSTFNISDVLQEKQDGGGTARVYPLTMEQAWSIARTVLRWEGAGTIEEHRAAGWMITSGSDAVMGVWIEDVPAGGVRVTFVSNGNRSFVTPHQRFVQAAGMVKDGKTLPTAAPPPPRAP